MNKFRLIQLIVFTAILALLTTPVAASDGGDSNANSETTSVDYTNVEPLQSKYYADPNLKFGQYVIVDPGERREVKTTVVTTQERASIHSIWIITSETSTDTVIHEGRPEIVHVGNQLKQTNVLSQAPVQYIKNPSLEFNEQVLVQQGVDETEDVTTTYDIDEETSIRMQEHIETIHHDAVPHIIAIGNVQTYDEKIEFKIITRENPNLDEGATNVLQEGKDGLKKVTVTYDINGDQLVNPVLTEDVIEEKVDKIIEIGIKQPTKSETVSSAPKTSDNGIYTYLIIALISGIGFVYMIKTRLKY